MFEFTFINENIALFVLYAFLGFSMALTALFGTMKWINKWRVPVLVGCFSAFLVLSYVSLGELLGRAKPVDIMTWDRPDVKSASVEGAYFIEGKAIFLLLMYEGLESPRYYQFPWSRRMAEKVNKGLSRKEARKNRGVRLNLPFQKTYEGRDFPEVYEVPWPAPPTKDEEQHDVIDLDSIDV